MQTLLEEMADSERKNRALLKERTPEEWARAVRQIEDRDLRCRVGCVVWWDYFAYRPVPERWHHLDRYVNSITTPDVSIDALRVGLFQVGYTAHQAEMRLTETIFPERNPRRNSHVRI